jgi:2',3'-cyclic-nucleotide 2'-phosphodiesterase/3'-nucleotidase
MKRILVNIIAAAAVMTACCGPKDGEYTVRILTTNDVHGHYFDSLYISDQTAPSIMSAAWVIDSVRVAAGEENVILIDAGDSMHGDNAAYFYNYVETDSEHVWARILEYLKYDAWIPGNHDFETGHPVYDRVAAGLDVPVLAANAVHADDRTPYFQEYVTVKKNGLKFTIIGFTNPNIKNAYAPELWDGLDFISLYPDFAQDVVDRIKAKENPDAVIVAIHSGAGRGDGSVLEQQGLDLFRSLRGVDLIVSSHDHRAAVMQNDSIAFVNTGNYCANLGCSTITLKVENGKVTGRSVSAELIPLDKDKVDKEMQAVFQPDYEAVKAYITRPVGEVMMDLNGMDALCGMSDYVNLLHTVCLQASDAQISFAAPQSQNLLVKAGTVIYNDLFTLYSYENQLYVVKMTGKEIKDYLEHSYDGWINTLDRKQDHVLKMRGFTNPRTGRQMWMFGTSAYNLDSAGGLVYEVDVTKPFGERVFVRSLADGNAFDESAEYKVAMNSYRARGGADLMKKAGVDTENIDARITGVHADIRTLLNDYIEANTPVDHAKVSNPEVIGHWSFVPEKKARKALDDDIRLLLNR